MMVPGCGKLAAGTLFLGLHVMCLELHLSLALVSGIFTDFLGSTSKQGER